MSADSVGNSPPECWKLQGGAGHERKAPPSSNTVGFVSVVTRLPRNMQEGFQAGFQSVTRPSKKVPSQTENLMSEVRKQGKAKGSSIAVTGVLSHPSPHPQFPRQVSRECRALGEVEVYL